MASHLSNHDYHPLIFYGGDDDAGDVSAGEEDEGQYTPFLIYDDLRNNK